MLTSNTQIVNLALSKLGDDRIVDIEDAVKPAKVAKAIFEPQRDAEIRRYNWRFSLTRALLQADSTPPAWGYARTFTMPTDSLRLLQVGDQYIRPGKPTPLWEREGRKVLTNLAAPLCVRYVRRVEDPAEFDALFVETLACRLAFEMAEALTQLPAKKEAAWKAYNAALEDAIRCDAMETLPVAYGGTTWAEDAYGEGSSLTNADAPFYGSGYTVA